MDCTKPKTAEVVRADERRIANIRIYLLHRVSRYGHGSREYCGTAYIVAQWGALLPIDVRCSKKWFHSYQIVL